MRLSSFKLSCKVTVKWIEVNIILNHTFLITEIIYRVIHSEETPKSNYKSRNNLPMKKETWRICISVNVKIIGLQKKKLKLVSLHLETQADTTLNAPEYCSPHGWRN
jgi:hypothetical protein